MMLPTDIKKVIKETKKGAERMQEGAAQVQESKVIGRKDWTSSTQWNNLPRLVQ